MGGLTSSSSIASSMQREIKTDSKEFALFQDFWDFRQEFYSPQTENDFKATTEALNDRMESYNGTELERLARALFMVHLEDAELRYINGIKKRR